MDLEVWQEESAANEPVAYLVKQHNAIVIEARKLREELDHIYYHIAFGFKYGKFDFSLVREAAHQRMDALDLLRAQEGE